jgi:hypothetical protein
MVVALLAFGRLYYVTHRDAASETPPGDRAGAPAPKATPTATVSPACRTLERALHDALRAPQDAAVQAKTRQQLDACPEPPPRACELGPALAVRAPLSAGEDAPLRGLLASLCERCPPAANSCAQAVSGSLLQAAVGGPPDLAELRWALAHAGKGTEAACASLVRLGLAPAAQPTVTLSPGVRALVLELAPLCDKAGFLPAPVLRAAAVQLGSQAPALVALAAGPTVESTPIEPDVESGPEARRQAFDGDVNTGVTLSNAAPGERWEADGAMRAGYTPTLKQLVSLQVRATGPGTLRAIIRTPRGVGLEDPEGGFFFVNPTVCRFQGTGQWEICKPAVPLTDVDAVSVFPERAGVELKELEIIGAR